MKTYCLILLIPFISWATIGDSHLVRRKRELINEYVNPQCEVILNDATKYDNFVKKNELIKAKIRFVLKTLGQENKIEDTYIPITKPEELCNNEKYKRSKPSVIFISGFTTNLREERSPSHDALANAFVKHRPQVNFMTIDTADYLDPAALNYYKSALNTLRIATYLADALKVLIKTRCFSRPNLQLIGHSLGAQICGKIGRELQKENISLPQITGLDPASPCFYGELMPGLSEGDAMFVDIIHTDPGTFGKSGRVGDVDFYPNGGVLKEIAPACEANIFNPKSWWILDNICSHALSWAYYAESVVPENKNDFIPTECYLDGDLKCNYKKYAMGYAVNQAYPKGVYILSVNKKCPFGRNSTVGTNVCTIFKDIDDFSQFL